MTESPAAPPIDDVAIDTAMEHVADPVKRYRSRITLVAALVVVLALVFFFYNYGTWTVIDGMDTMGEAYPVGATCIVQKSPSAVKKGSVVLLEVEGGAALLSRVDRVEGDRIHIRHDNRKSRFLEFEAQTYPLSAVRALGLTALLPDQPPPPIDGR